MKWLLDRVLDACTQLAGLGPSRVRGVSRYAVALALVVVATVVRLAIAPQESGIPYVTYFPAATLAAIIAGLGPAMVATVVGALTAAYLFIPPFGAIKLDAEAVVSALVFIADEIIVCVAIEAMRRYYSDYLAAAKAAAEAHAAEKRSRLAAEQANAAKSRFLAAASHDLRQPYQALRLFLATLQSRTLTEDRREAVLANMDRAMTAGEELLQSLLDVSTLEAGVVVPKPAPVSTRALAAALEVKHRAPAEARGLRLRVRSCDVWLELDPVLLGRILDNLVTNAIRYTERGGVLVSCRRRGGGAVFEVWDTGIGIAPEHREAIFEEFFQVANPARDRSKGVGLGLAVVSKTARLLGLTVDLVSRLDRGTRFRVTVPPQALRPPPEADAKRPVPMSA